MTTINIKQATVQQVMQMLGNELKMQELSEGLGVSKTTIKDRIKKMGYKWDAKQGKYLPDATRGYAPGNDSKLLMDYFEKKPLEVAKSNVPVSPQIASEPASVGIDMIDVLLNLKPAERVQRAYYIDKDLADIIDQVTGHQKSNLINECIRKVFKEKGIL